MFFGYIKVRGLKLTMIYTTIKEWLRDKRLKMSYVMGYLTLKLNGVEYGKRIRIAGRCYVRNLGKIKLGNNIKINSAYWNNTVGSGCKTCLDVWKDAELSIGHNTGISNTEISVLKSVTIGNDVLIGGGCKIYDSDFHPLESIYRYGSQNDWNKTKHREVIIEDGCFIGASSIILKGSHIGKNSIIGAGSVVSGVIPENEIWAGNPAKFIRKIK